MYTQEIANESIYNPYEQTETKGLKGIRRWVPIEVQILPYGAHSGQNSKMRPKKTKVAHIYTFEKVKLDHYTST